MNYFNLKFRVDFLGHVKNVIINILFFTVYPFVYGNLRIRVHVADTVQRLALMYTSCACLHPFLSHTGAVSRYLDDKYINYSYLL